MQQRHFHLIKKIDREGYATTYTYNDLGQKIKEERCGREITYTYDGLGRLCLSDEGEGRITSYTRDFLGRVIEENRSGLFKITYAYDAAGNRALVNGKEKSVYDPFNRLIRLEDALGNITTIEYQETDHLEKITTDPRGVITKEVFDPYGRLIKKDLTEMSYDLAGNLIEHRLPGYITVFTYTKKNQLASYTRGGQTTSFTYTPKGNKASKIAPDGVTVSYQYDSFDNLIAMNGHRLRYNRLGYLVQLDGIQREVDPFGNVLKEVFPAYIVEKSYDRFDRPLTLKIGDREIHYTYDPLYLREVGINSYVHSYDDYDLEGHLLSESLIGNLGSINYSYDPKGRQIASSSPYHTENLSYDPIDNLIRKCEKTFAYDDFSRLIQEPGESYVYDANGNRLSFAVNDRDELLDFPYDLRGNQLTNNGLSLEYDPLNRLIKAGDFSYSYDALGRRLTKTSPDGTVDHYLYDGDQEIGVLGKEFRVIGNDTVAIEIDEKLYAPLIDIQGNISHLVDLETQETAVSYDYSAFAGSVISFNPWQYAQKRFDPELNLIYFGHRYYNPLFARWLTADPLDFLDGYNLYTYAHNNPFRYFDPDGRFAFAIPLFSIAIGAGKVIFTAATAAAITALAAAYTGIKLGQAIRYAREASPTPTSPTLERKPDDTGSEDPKPPSPLDPRVPLGGEVLRQGYNKVKEELQKTGRRFTPASNASGSHTVFRRDPTSGKINHYETYRPQTNPRNPNPWESVKRYDGSGKGHTNKISQEKIETPHIHDPASSGGIRKPYHWEIP